MAHSLSARKRVRQNVRRRALNRARRSTLKTKLRQCSEAGQHGGAEDVERQYKEAVKVLDRAASRRTLHRNAAARRKSRLARRLNALKKKAAGA